MSSGRRPVSMAIWMAALTSAGSQGVQAGAQHGHDLRRQVPAGLAALGLGGDVAEPEGEVTGQPGGRLAGPGQAQGADPGQRSAGAAADDVAVVAADRPGRLEVAEPVEEALDVGPAERGRDEPAVVAGAQAFATAAPGH